MSSLYCYNENNKTEYKELQNDISSPVAATSSNNMQSSSSSSTPRHLQCWKKSLSLQGFRADEVSVEVDRVFHNVVISAQRMNNPWLPAHMAQTSNKFKRVINMPENIDLDQLRVHMDTEKCKLKVKAPFMQREDLLTKAQCLQQHEAKDEEETGRTMSCVNVPVMWKSEPSSTVRPMPTTAGPSSNGWPDMSRCTVLEYLRLMKQAQCPTMSCCKPTSMEPSAMLPSSCCTIGKFITAEIVKEENSDKWKWFFDINAVGFRREEIHVTFMADKERMLVVEMRHDSRKSTTPMSTTGQPPVPSTVMMPQGPMSMKQVREEILLPLWLDGKQMRFRLMENGVLRIQMPCLCEPWPKMKQQMM